MISRLEDHLAASADDVERAREIENCDSGLFHCFIWYDEQKLCANCTKIAAALTAARREERVRCVELIGRWETENVRLIHERDAARREGAELDEAVVEAMAEAIFLASNEQAAVHPKMAWADASPGLQAKYRAVALATRDAAIRERPRDIVITEQRDAPEMPADRPAMGEESTSARQVRRDPS